nr:DUF5134 domain-containing protein [Nocardia bovistercoris]
MPAAAPGSDALVAGYRGVAADGHREGDAAHLIMCLVMATMVVFPSGVDPQAMRGVLTATTVAFALLLAGRIARWRGRLPGDEVPRAAVLGYHTAASAAMLSVMSGHTATGHAAPAPMLAYGAAAVFAVDAVVTLLALGRRHWFGHGSGDAPAMIPHLIMDAGMVYMLVGAVAG